MSLYLICILNTTDCISIVQPQTFFCVIVFVWKYLAFVLEHKKTLVCVCLSIGNLLLLCFSSLKSLAFVLDHL